MSDCFHALYRYAVCRVSVILVLTSVLALLGPGSALAQFGEPTQYFPHFASGGGWTTSFAIHNPTTGNITVQAQLFRSDATPVATRDVVVAAGGSQTLTFEQTPTFITGWARLTSTARFSASELFQFFNVGGQLLSQVGVLPAVDVDQFKLFGKVQSGTSTFTGIAIANPSGTVESVLTVNRLNSSGQLLDSRTVRLGPLGHLARFLHEEPYFPGLDNFDGIVEVSATQPISAVTLRLDGPEVAAIAVITAAESLTNGSVTSVHLADAAVISSKLANGAVTTASILDGTITNSDIASSAAILPAKIAGTAATLGSNNFSGAQSITGNLSISTGNLSLPVTGNAASGVLTSGPNRFLHSYGTANTFLGIDVGNFQMTGTFNTGIGLRTLTGNSIGGFNTALGADALLVNATGHNNTAIGASALQQNATGLLNAALGIFALRNNTTGSSNTAVGENALSSNTTGSANTAIGAFANVSSSNLNNATAIGQGAVVNASNKIRLGNTTVTVLESQVGLTVVSDRNAKENFQSIDAEDILKRVSQVPVTSWNYIGHDPQQFRHYGPMAQDFFAAFGHDGAGTIGSDTSINSSDLSGVLMLAVKALEKRTADLQAENAELKTQLRERVEKLEQLLVGSEPRQAQVRP